jgi:peptidase C39-like protein
MGLQLKLVADEIDAYYGKALLADDFGTVSDPKTASYIFMHVYEKAGNPKQAVRDNAAQKYYEKFKSLAPDATAGGDGAVSCESANGDAADVTDSGFVVYNQYDPKWANKAYGSSTIGDSGCGPSAMAMIITALTGKRVTPEDTSKYAGSKGMYIPGNGSDWAVAGVLAEHWGLKAKNIDNSVSAINAVLKSGGMIATSGSGAAPFTRGGHYIAIRGLTDSGKWKIGDSNGKAGTANSQKEWDPRHILDIANAGNIVAITK